jgi:hypothetical protein
MRYLHLSDALKVQLRRILPGSCRELQLHRLSEVEGHPLHSAGVSI